MPRNVEYEDVGRVHSSIMGTEKIGLNYKGVITHLKVAGQILTEAGDCGSALILCNNNTTCKIVGIHNAANNFNGFCSIVFQDYLKPKTPILVRDECSQINKNKPKYKEYHKNHSVDMVDSPDTMLLGMKIVGKGTVSKAIPTSTKFWSSPLALPGPSPYQPAITSPFDRRNQDNIHPYYKSVEKWSSPQPLDLDLDLLDRSVDDVAEYYATTCFIQGAHCSILTKTTALNAGIEHGLTQLNRQSSPGYPWTKFNDKKQDFLEIHEDKHDNIFWKFNNSEGAKAVEHAIDNLINTCRDPLQIKPLVVFSGSIKDEPVKLNKIYSVESRSFAGAPFDYVVAMRMYYGAAVGAIHNCRHLLPSKIGINPTSLEWHLMVTDLLEVSDVGFDADYKNFDSTALKEIIKRIPRVYNRIYQLCDPNWKQEHDIIRENLNNALYEPLLAVPAKIENKQNVFILQARGGHVSGQPLTADTNSLINLINLRMCWLDTFKDNPEMQPMNVFLAYVRAIIYGDDICVAVKPDIIHLFNCEVFVNFMKKLNITVTDAAKSGTIKPFIKVENFEFLKRTFKKAGAYYVGPLSENSFHKMLDYTIGPQHFWDSEPQALQCNKIVLRSTMDSALQEAIFHGPLFYNQIYSHLLKKAREYSIDWDPLSYNQMVDFKKVPLPKQ
uniref:RdRp catalytic domain-containing protein n=1 Tax=Suncus murinus ribovirus 1 TaxID=3139575 RepID=A0AB38ZKB1_9VIRU